MSLLFNMLYVSHSFSSKEQASFIFMARVTIHSDFEPKKIKSLTVSIVSPSLFFPIFPNCFSTSLPWSDGTRCHDFSFMNVEFQVSFFTLLFHFHQEALQFLFAFCHKGGCPLHIWGYWYFSQQSWVQPVLHKYWHFIHLIHFFTLVNTYLGWCHLSLSSCYEGLI